MWVDSTDEQKRLPDLVVNRPKGPKGFQVLTHPCHKKICISFSRRGVDMETVWVEAQAECQSSSFGAWLFDVFLQGGRFTWLRPLGPMRIDQATIAWNQHDVQMGSKV